MRRLSTAESIAGCPSCDSQAHCAAERYNVIQQYAITLPDNSPFLSMPSRKKWILHGQSNDSFGFKYWLGFNVSRGTGEYSPATQHAEARPLPSCCASCSVLSLGLSFAVKRRCFTPMMCSIPSEALMLQFCDWSRHCQGPMLPRHANTWLTSSTACLPINSHTPKLHVLRDYRRLCVAGVHDHRRRPAEL